jgi:hypothetical protein
VDTSVVFLTRRDLELATDPGPLPRRSQHRWCRRFRLDRIDVPGDVFDPQEDPDTPLARLQDAIWQAPARLGGCPMWVREPNDPRDLLPPMTPARPRLPGVRGGDTFVMQFERRFAEVELGNAGIMYVSGSGAYYQDYPRLTATRSRDTTAAAHAV